MAKTPPTLTKKAAAKRLGVSVRSLERLVQAGRLRSGLRRGARAMEAFFIAADLDALKADLTAEREKAVTEPVKREANSLARIPPRLAADLANLAETIRGSAATAPVTHSDLRAKLTLTVAEAVKLSGLPDAIIRRAIQEDRLPALRTGAGYRLRLRDLEALIERMIAG
jgi:excisionase family DNA binding protein